MKYHFDTLPFLIHQSHQMMFNIQQCIRGFQVKYYKFHRKLGNNSTLYLNVLKIYGFWQRD